MQAALDEGCVVDGAHAAEHAHQLKVRKYSARFEREGLAFIPLAVDTFGRWHPKALEVITTLGRQLARNVGREGGEAVRHLRQRLGVMLVRDSVAMLCARTPTFAPLRLTVSSTGTSPESGLSPGAREFPAATSYPG